MPRFFWMACQPIRGVEYGLRDLKTVCGTVPENMGVRMRRKMTDEMSDAEYQAAFENAYKDGYDNDGYGNDGYDPGFQEPDKIEEGGLFHWRGALWFAVWKAINGHKSNR